MTPGTPVSIKDDCTSDVTLHEEIKRRAYELYEQRDQFGGHNSETALQTELPRVLYAAVELKKYANGQVRNTQSVRAARVYMRALCSCLAEHWERSKPLSYPCYPGHIGPRGGPGSLPGE